jgi:hypothetical protein
MMSNTAKRWSAVSQLSMSNGVDDFQESDESSEEEEEEYTGTWDDRVREICQDMCSKKSAADHHASEKIQDMLKKNGDCELSN